MKKQAVYRQGDVLIESISEIPTTAIKQNPARKIILAHGEVTGHHHSLQVAFDSADWWKQGEIAPTLEKPRAFAGEIFMDLPEGCVVTHQEHSEIRLPRGKYRVSRQREYSPEAVRNVAD